MRKYSILTALMAVTFTLIAQFAVAANIEVDNAWVRAMPPTSRVIPIYLTINNPTDKSVGLIKISSPRGFVVIHQSVMRNDMMQMEPVESVPVPAKGVAKLQPTGYHGMMNNFTDGVPTKGENVPLVLMFNNGKELTVMAKVK
ncbi:MAG: copper chaperone PCu(A)C [Oceanospirillaceae bacterium]